ncbi:MAG: hypothetical protein C0594_11860, partial [Marinilabiliales bacterium]
MRRLISLLFFLTIPVFVTFAQNDRSFIKKLEEADYYFSYDSYYDAFPIYLDLYYSDSSDTDINFKLGVCYFFTVRDFTGAKKYLETARKDFPAANYYLGRIYHAEEKFDNAIEAFRDYKNYNGVKNYDNSLLDFLIDKSITAKKMIANKSSAVIKNIGAPVNSPYPDYVPVISSDERFLLFTSRRKGGVSDAKDPRGEYFEDIYMAKNKIGEWSEPVNLGRPVNSETHDACISLTQDGQKLFMFRTNNELTGGDIYESYHSGDQWSEP